MTETIASLVENAQVFSANDLGNTIHKYFEGNKKASGVVIVDEDNKPIGLIMRTHFYQMIGTQFGFSIYMNRSINLLMKTKLLCLDISYDLAQFGFKAMNRDENDVFDFVVIVKDGKFQGIVSINNFLSVMSEIKQREIELLNEQRRILEESHEKERRLRREIEIKNRSIKSLLDNADQGFLSFNADLIIYEEHSSVCNKIFMRPIAGMDFAVLMQAFLDEKQHTLLVESLEGLFKQKNEVRAKVYLKLLPHEFRTDNRYINITYKLISFNESKILMVILTDITDRKSLENKAQEEKNNMKLILSAINSKTEIIDAVEEAREFFTSEARQVLEQQHSVKDILTVLFRVIHTMKGDFALRSLHNTAINLHLLEEQFAAMLKEPEKYTPSMLRSLMTDIDFNGIIREDMTIIEEFLGEGFLDSDKKISINYDRLDSFIHAIKDRYTGEERQFLIRGVQELTYPALNSILQGYSGYIEILALKLNKSIAEIKIGGDAIYINRQIYAKFLKSMIHIFRNIVDHAIEIPEERIEKGKDEQGEIRCAITKDNAHFVIEISDDGKGIDPTGILSLARKKGIYSDEQVANLSEEEIINTIFLDSFSTKNEVSMLSGRGVGLSAVRNEILALQGTIEARSKNNEGTTFTITLPYLDQL
jgi:two-component system, chemotaxis family, sensor kinase CheA